MLVFVKKYNHVFLGILEIITTFAIIGIGKFFFRNNYTLNWLLKNNIYWIVVFMAILLAFIKKQIISLTIFAGNIVGIVIGDVFGSNQSGAEFGFGHFGWAIWGFVLFFSIVLGVLLKIKLTKDKENNEK